MWVHAIEVAARARTKQAVAKACAIQALARVCARQWAATATRTQSSNLERVCGEAEDTVARAHAMALQWRTAE